MTSVMLATYPELFSGGAIIAGLPFGSASNIPQALERMRGQGGPGEKALADAVRAASPSRGPWPTVSVWHGTGDRTVTVSNADAIVAQWRGIHNVGEPQSDTVEGHSYRVWRDRDGRAAIEEYRVKGMGHGTPLKTQGEDSYGTPGAHMLEAAISSTFHIARSWGLVDSERRAPVSRSATGVQKSTPVGTGVRQPSAIEAPVDTKPTPATGVGKVIEDALRAAGLMR